MRINNNLMAMNTHRQLGINAGNGAKSIEKLSSGYRINRAGDDAAGLAISEKMRAQIRGLNQASRNSQDAISLVQTAEGALNESQAILQRMRELAVQSANDTNVDSDRSEIQKEINQLTSEVNRIGNTTEFNTKKLLNGGEAKAGRIRYTENATGDPATGSATGVVTAVNEATESIAAGTVAVSALTTNAASVKAADSGTIGSPLTETATSTGAGTVAIEKAEIVAGGLGVVAANPPATPAVDTTTAGVDNYQITTQFGVGNTITVDGQTFTAVAAGEGNSATQFEVGADINATVANLDAAFSANTSITGTYTVSSATDTLTLTETDDSDGSADNAGAAVIAAGTNNATYGVEFKSDFTVGDSVDIGGLTFTAVANGTGTVAADGTLTFDVGADLEETVDNLTAQIAAQNSINAAYTVTQAGSGWGADENSITITKTVAGDDAASADYTTNVAATQTAATEGEYQFEIATDYEVGQKIDINGLDFTAVTGVANAAAGEFSIDSDIEATADSLLAAINASTLVTGGTFEAAILEDGAGTIAASGFATDGDTIVLKETTASGDVMADVVTVATENTTAVSGDYTFEISENFSRFDQVTIGSNSYKAGTAADVLAGDADFEIGATIDASVTDLVAKIDAQGDYDATKGSTAFGTGDKITLVENGVASGGAAPALSVTQATEQAGAYEFQVTTNFVDGDRIAIDGVGLVAGDDFTVGADADATAANIKTAIDADATLSAKYTVAVSNNQLTLTEKAGQADGAVLANPTVSQNAVAGEFEFTMVELSKDASLTVDGEKLTFATGGTVAESAAELKTLVDGNATLAAKYDVVVADTKVTLTQKVGQESETAPTLAYETAAGSGFNATMQIGANTGQSMNITMGDMRADALDISSSDGAAEFVEVDGKQYEVAWTAAKTVNSGTENVETEFALDVSTSDNATSAVEVINDAINKVSGERSKLGAFQNRLEHTIKNLDTSAENLQASESRIRDVDMAKEMMTFTKNNILQQAAQSMLAQANQAPQGVLQLLR